MSGREELVLVELETLGESRRTDRAWGMLRRRSCGVPSDTGVGAASAWREPLRRRSQFTEDPRSAFIANRCYGRTKPIRASAGRSARACILGMVDKPGVMPYCLMVRR